MTLAKACHVLLIGGSLRAGSTNAAVLKTALREVPSGVSATIYTGLADLPHFNPDDDCEPLPAPAQQLRAQLDAADAVLFCTPEYAGSLPGSFKNLLDWSVGGGLYEKPVAFINASAFGAAQSAHAMLRVVLGYVSATIVEDACIQLPVRRDQLGSDGMLHDPQLTAAIAGTLRALAQHVVRHAP